MAEQCENQEPIEITEPESIQSKNDKVNIFLKATANAPILKQKNWKVEPDRTVSSINAFVKKYLKLEQSDSLFLYVNQTFAPAADQTVKNLYECFGTDGKLVLHYCLSPAWG